MQLHIQLPHILGEEHKLIVNLVDSSMIYKFSIVVTNCQTQKITHVHFVMFSFAIKISNHIFLNLNRSVHVYFATTHVFLFILATSSLIRNLVYFFLLELLNLHNFLFLSFQQFIVS